MRGADKGREGKVRGEGKRGEGREKRRGGVAPNANSWIRPCSVSSIQHRLRQFLRTSLVLPSKYELRFVKDKKLRII